MNKRNFTITELPKGRGFIAHVYGVIGYADMKRFDRLEDAEAYLARARGEWDEERAAATVARIAGQRRAKAVVA